MKMILISRLRSKKAMSMIELLVAVLVLTIGILAIAGVVPAAVRTITKNRVLTRAVEYTQQEMEALKRLGYSNLAVVTEDHFNPSGDTRYETWITVTDNVGGATNIRMVTITTSMRPGVNEDELGPNDFITMTSYFTQ